MKRVLTLCLLLVLLAIPVFPQSTGPTYYYVVTSVDSFGFESVFSTQVTAAFTQGKHVAVLSWTAATTSNTNATIAGYNVYRGQTSGGPYTKVNSALVSAVTYSDTFVPPNAPSGLAASIQ